MNLTVSCFSHWYISNIWIYSIRCVVGRPGFTFLIIVWCIKQFKMLNITELVLLLPGRLHDLRSELLLSFICWFQPKRQINTTCVKTQRLSMFLYVQFYAGATRCSQSNRVYKLKGILDSVPTNRAEASLCRVLIWGSSCYKHVYEFSHSLPNVSLTNVCRPEYPGITGAVKKSIQYVRM